MYRYRASVASVVLGAAFAAVAFGAASGTDLGRSITVEICLLLAGALAVAVGVLWAEDSRPRYGLATLAFFGILTAITAMSVLWSYAPDQSFIEGGRTFSYLAVFAGAVAIARLAPHGATVLLSSVLIAVAVLVVFALAARVWPASLGAGELSNRISRPFGYWNALGTTAAMAVPGALWLGSRRYGQPLLNALAFPFMGVLLVTIMLTQSRGALAAAAVGAALWFAAVPLRLRSLPTLIAGALGAAPVVIWALSKDAFSKALQSDAVRESVAGQFGMLLLLMVVVLFGVGLAVSLGHRRVAPPMRLRRTAGAVAVAVVCLIPLAGITSVAFSDRGLEGTISHQATQLTQDKNAAPTGAARLTSSSSSRSRYWREAIDVYKQRPTIGTGAGAYSVSALRFHKDNRVAKHAHGFVVQTMSDLGLLGLAAIVLLTLAWLAAAGRATGLGPRISPAMRDRLAGVVKLRASPRRDWDAERVTVVALALAVISFGVQSTIDWTWFFPGCTVLMLVAAGFVAALGPVGHAPGQVATSGAPAAMRGPERTSFSLPRFPGWGRVVAAVAIMATAVLAAWSTYQPQHSERLTDSAQNAAANHDLKGALAKLQDAQSANPLSPHPLLVTGATLTSTGRIPEARAAYQRAVTRNPGTPRTWLALADFEIGPGNRPQAALDAAGGVLYLDPSSIEGRAVFLQARRRLAARLQERAAARQAARAPAPAKAKPAKPAKHPKAAKPATGGGATAPPAKGAGQ